MSNLLVNLVSVLPRPWIKALSSAQWKSRWFKRAFDWGKKRLVNRDGIIQQGVGKGLRFNPGHANAGYLLGTSEPEVQTALAALLRPGMTVYDLGANVGFLSVIAARLVGPKGRVICFEPLPSNAQQIEHNARLNGFTHMTVRREALGSADGESSFLVSAEPTIGKLASVSATVARYQSSINVVVRCLDTLIPEAGLSLPDAMKIDIEGAEVDALKGATNIIRQGRPLLLIELHDTNLGVAHQLSEWGYHAVVLGAAGTVAEALWNAFILAAPQERADLVAALQPLTLSAVGV